MKLTFIEPVDKQEVIGCFETKEQAVQKIAEVLRDKGYKSPYWRCIAFDNKWVYDVGFWSKFFVIYKDDNAELVGVWDEA